MTRAVSPAGADAATIGSWSSTKNQVAAATGTTPSNVPLAANVAGGSASSGATNSTRSPRRNGITKKGPLPSPRTGSEAADVVSVPSWVTSPTIATTDWRSSCGTTVVYTLVFCALAQAPKPSCSSVINPSNPSRPPAASCDSGVMKPNAVALSPAAIPLIHPRNAASADEAVTTVVVVAGSVVVVVSSDVVVVSSTVVVVSSTVVVVSATVVVVSSAVVVVSSAIVDVVASIALSSPPRVNSRTPMMTINAARTPPSNQFVAFERPSGGVPPGPAATTGIGICSVGHGSGSGGTPGGGTAPKSASPGVPAPSAGSASSCSPLLPSSRCVMFEPPVLRPCSARPHAIPCRRRSHTLARRVGVNSVAHRPGMRHIDERWSRLLHLAPRMLSASRADRAGRDGNAVTCRSRFRSPRGCFSAVPPGTVERMFYDRNEAGRTDESEVDFDLMSELETAWILEADSELSDLSPATGDSIPARLDEMAPGPCLAGFLASIDVSGLSGHDRVTVLRAQRRMESHYAARAYESISAVTDSLLDEDGDPELATASAAAEVRAALSLTRRAADATLFMALDVTRRLPRVWEALASGNIDVPRARVIAHGTTHLSVAGARQVAERVIDRASSWTTGQLGAQIRRLCIDVDPAEAAQRYDDAVADRRVVCAPTEDGTADLLGLNLPPQRAAAAMRHINRLARRLRTAAESRTMDQLRADVALDLLTGAHAHGSGTDRGVVDIRVDLATLTHLTEDSGKLAGFGPVIADIARQVTEAQRDAEWRWILTDRDSGQPLAGGTTRRRPTSAERRHVEARDGCCVFPGCRMPGSASDLDHRIRYADGGPTDQHNLAPLCRHDHRTRHDSNWTYERLPNGDYQWTTRLGHHYRTSGQPP